MPVNEYDMRRAVEEHIERQERLKPFIRMMPYNTRRVLYLRFWRGMLPSEIHRRTQLSVPSINGRIHRAMMQLRTYLKDI